MQTWQHFGEIAHPPHAGHHLGLLQEVVEVELLLHDALRDLVGFIGLDGLFGLLDQCQHISHACKAQEISFEQNSCKAQEITYEQYPCMALLHDCFCCLTAGGTIEMLAGHKQSLLRSLKTVVKIFFVCRTKILQ